MLLTCLKLRTGRMFRYVWYIIRFAITIFACVLLVEIWHGCDVWMQQSTQEWVGESRARYKSVPFTLRYPNYSNNTFSISYLSLLIVRKSCTVSLTAHPFICWTRSVLPLSGFIDTVQFNYISYAGSYRYILSVLLLLFSYRYVEWWTWYQVSQKIYWSIYP